MALKSRICEMLGIRYPILLAGMGGASVPALAAAVSNAGGLGVLGAAACSPDQLRDWIRQTRELTDKPFGVDTLLPASVRRGSAPQSGAAPQNPMDLMGEYQQFARDFMDREELPEVDAAAAMRAAGAPEMGKGGPQLFSKEFFEAQMEVVIEEKVPVYAAGLGNPEPWMDRLHANGTKVMAVIGKVKHAEQVVGSGIDMIVAQGHDGGGHNSPIGTISLIPQVVDAVGDRVPVLGAGGISDGRGVAAAFWVNGTGPACATASVNGDGTVSLTEGSPDIGGGRVSMAIQMAEVLGIPAEDVHPSVGDTDAVGYTSLTAGSGATFKSGWASYEAAHDIKQQMIERAARIWEIDVKDVEFKEGVASHKSDPELKLNFKQIAARLNSTGGPIVGRGNVNPAGVGNAFAVHIVDVEVDPDTGKVDILRYTALQDVGKAVHPSYVEGQLQGGVAQGIGWALNEEYVYNDSGEMSNSSFLDYRMPTSLDLPMIDTVIVEVANPGHPFGVRGVGEVCIVPPMGAVANAIHNAAGVRMDVLPMSPANVLEALWAKDGE